MASLVLSRLTPVANIFLRQSGKTTLQRPIIRNASVLYRNHAVKEPAISFYLGEGMSFFLWYWILYHCYFEYDHLVPPHSYPDPTKFTDEELGIPPDDEE